MKGDITKLHNKYKGERIFLIGNGPSLNNTPLELLKNEYSMGFNKIHKIYTDTEWRPSFYVNGCSLEQNIRSTEFWETVNIGIPCFFYQRDSKYLPGKNNIFVLNDKKIQNYNSDVEKTKLDVSNITGFENIWSDDISECIYRYNTTIFPGMQIAYYMGFSEIYLVGCDLYPTDQHILFDSAGDPADYEGEGISGLVKMIKKSGKPIKSVCNGVAYKIWYSKYFNYLFQNLSKVIGYSKTKTHFSANYETKIRNRKRLNKKHNLNHKLAAKISDTYNFSIYNATQGGNLEVYPRVEFENVLDDK